MYFRSFAREGRFKPASYGMQKKTFFLFKTHSQFNLSWINFFPYIFCCCLEFPFINRPL